MTPAQERVRNRIVRLDSQISLAVAALENARSIMLDLPTDWPAVTEALRRARWDLDESIRQATTRGAR